MADCLLEQGKPLTRAYAAAIMSMLPQTSYNAKVDDAAEDYEDAEAAEAAEQEDSDAFGDGRPKIKAQHEPINDVWVHRYSMQQLFIPTSESREFTREDAAKAFHETLKPADERVPIPELIKLEKLKLAGVPEEEARAAYEEEVKGQEQRLAKRASRIAEEEAARLTKVESGRFEFRFRDVNADVVGRTGKHPQGVGVRYGAPLQDRKRGLSKIPTSFP